MIVEEVNLSLIEQIHLLSVIDLLIDLFIFDGVSQQSSIEKENLKLKKTLKAEGQLNNN